jgi:hypothetical protein
MHLSLLAKTLCVLPVAILLACAQPPQSNQAPQVSGAHAFLVAEEGCAVVMGGSVGSAFADRTVSKFWHTVNDEITAHLYRQLEGSRHRVVRLTIDAEGASRIDALVVQALMQNRCSRVIQVTTDVNEDKQGRYFAFDIAQLRFVPNARAAQGGTNTTAKAEYSRKYRFPRTSESFDSFNTGTFAQTAFDDLRASGALEPIRQK